MPKASHESYDEYEKIIVSEIDIQHLEGLAQLHEELMGEGASGINLLRDTTDFSRHIARVLQMQISGVGEGLAKGGAMTKEVEVTQDERMIIERSRKLGRVALPAYNLIS